MENAVKTETDGEVTIITLDRPQVRNAVDPSTAAMLAEAFIAFDENEATSVAVFVGAHGTFCAGADLKSVAAGNFQIPAAPEVPLPPHARSGPMGPTHMRLSKPVIAAISGHAVAGGLELALWCDLRVVEETAVLGVFCRRWGVPLIDGGTVRLPRLIGHSRAMDLILTGRPVDAAEALTFGLANRVVPKGEARNAAVALAHEISRFPQACLRNDRASAYAQWDLSFDEAMAHEAECGRQTIESLETVRGAGRFADGHGRGGRFDDI